MRRLTLLDWIGGTVIWGVTSIVTGVFFSEGLGAPEEFGVGLAAVMFFGAVVTARLWVLRRVDVDGDSSPRVGLSTGEMTAQRLADMEARIYELEERLELTERLLAQATERPRLPLLREDSPA